MPDLLIRIKKHKDGTASLSCVRSDGSVTWQKQQGRQARFFPTHDLTHYAVETTLGHRRGFYGLVAEGWDLTDFGAPWPRGPIPDDADPSELFVGFLDAERAGGQEWSATDFNAKAATFSESRGLARPRSLTDAELARIRGTAHELFARWLGLPAGETLELAFDRAVPTT